jgi:glycerol kinase
VVKALVLDLGTTSLRTALVDEGGGVHHVVQAPLTVRSHQPGEVELDGHEIKTLALQCVGATLAAGGPADYVAITTQRASTMLYDPATLEPVGPVLGWQDLRTVIDCLVLQGEGLRFAPNQSATKAKWLLAASGRPAAELRIATLETWLAAVISNGQMHVSDHSNAAVTGLVDATVSHWDERVLATLGLDARMLPTLVPTMGLVGAASALPGAPVLAALVGDQSASLFGQGGILPGVTKVTFGTGAMLDQVTGPTGPISMNRFDTGCFPVVARSDANGLIWGVEAIALSAGTCIEWLRDDLGLITTAAETEALARSVASSDGVTFVPALVGLGTPQWDFGARGAFFGLTRGSSKAHLVRAVLEGIAHTAADLVAAAERESGVAIDTIRVDGGMAANAFLIQSFADAARARVEVSAEREATTRGAGLMALVAAGVLTLDDVVARTAPGTVVMPSTDEATHAASREAWARSVERAARTIPDLSNVSF